MSDRNYTIEILREECVGDSLGKHNFNLLALDTAICNLSSLFFKTDGGNTPLWSTFYDLSVNRALYDLNLSLMLDPYRFDVTSFGTSFLSAYWMKQELTVQYQFNKSTIPYVTGSTVSAVPDVYVEPVFNGSTFNRTLINNTLNYINSTYAVSDFNDRTVINVVIPIQATDGELIKSYSYQASGANGTLLTVSTSSLPSFDQVASTIPLVEFRKITALFKKEDNNILGNPIVRFIKDGNTWSLVTNTISILSAVAPDYTQQETVFSSISGIGTAVFANNLRITEGPCTPIAWGQLYSCDVYFSGDASAYGDNRYIAGDPLTNINGSGPRIGSLSVVFVDSNGTESEPYSYRATSSPNTYLRWDNDFITAYEGYGDDIKQVVQRWPNPYKNIPNIKFKFIKDDDAITYSVCASRKISSTL